MTGDDNFEPEDEPEDLVEKPVIPEIKMCVVQLQKLDVNVYIDSDSSDDLPQLPYLLHTPSSSKYRNKKSTKELMDEHENLARDIQMGNISNYKIAEKIKEIKIMPTEVEDASSSPSPAISEDKNSKIFLVSDTYQYFNISDVTPQQCGYDSMSVTLTEYEKTMMSFRRAELERVLSSFLFSSNVYCISDCKSFVTFLLRNMSVQVDVACVEACYNVLNTILDKHPSAKNINFSSAEIFMLLFNYGTDINSFKFLSKRLDILKYLEEPKDKIKNNRIPETWMFNLTTTLKAVTSLVINCDFNVKVLWDVIVYLLWMSLDSSLLHGNIFPTIRECISVSLDHVPPDKWPRVMREVVCTFINKEFSSSEVELDYVYYLAESVPVTSKRGLELRKYISFLALVRLGEVKSTQESLEQNISPEVNKTLDGFSLDELESLLQKLVEQGSDLAIKFSARFLDICVSHLEATDEEYKKLCDIVKNSESALNEKAYEAKAHFMKIHSRLRIRLGKNKMFKVETYEDKIHHVKVKKEVHHDVETESVPSAFQLVKVKQEPIQEHMSYVTHHKSEKIISFSEFDCENDDEDLDFGSIEKCDDISSIHMDVAHNTAKIEVTSNSDISGSDDDQNSLKSMPILSAYCSSNVDGKQIVSNSQLHADDAENTDNSVINSIEINPPVLDSIVPLDSCDNSSSPADLNQNEGIDNFGINEELVNCKLKLCEDPSRRTSTCELGLTGDSGLPAEFGNESKSFSVGSGISNLVTAYPGCERTAASCVTVSSDKQTVSLQDVIAVELCSSDENITSKLSSFSDGVISGNNSILSIDNSTLSCVGPLTAKPALPESDKLTSDKNILTIEQSDIPGTSGINADYGESIINQQDSVEALDNYKSDLSGVLLNSSAAYNITRAGGRLTDEFNNESDCEVITVEGLKDSVMINSRDDNHAEQNDYQISSTAKNDSVSNLVKSLVLPEGTVISPVKMDIHSTPKNPPEPLVQNGDVCGYNLENTAIDEEVIFIGEETRKGKIQKKQKEKSCVTHDPHDSDKELQILYIKLGSKNNSTPNKSHKDIPKHSERKPEKVPDEKVVLLTDNSHVCETISNLIASELPEPELSESKDFSHSSDSNIIASRNDATSPTNVDFTRAVELCPETEATKSADVSLDTDTISDNRLVSSEHVHSPLKTESCTLYHNKNVELIGCENLNISPKKSIESISKNGDITQCENNPTVKDSESSIEKAAPTANEETLYQDFDVLPECGTRNYELKDCERVNTSKTGSVESTVDKTLVDRGSDICQNNPTVDGSVSFKTGSIESTVDKTLIDRGSDICQSNPTVDDSVSSKTGSIESTVDKTLIDRSSAMCPTVDDSVSSVEKTTCTENEQVLYQDFDVANVEIVETMNESTPEKLPDQNNDFIKTTAVKEQVSIDNVASIENGCTLAEDAVKKDYLQIEVTTVKGISSLEEGKTDKSLLEKPEQSEKVQSTLAPERKNKHLERKSIDNVENQSLQKDVDKDAIHIVNNLKKSPMVLSEGDVTRNGHKIPCSTKSVSSKTTNFNSFSIPQSSVKVEIISSHPANHLPWKSDINSVNTLQNGVQEVLGIQKDENMIVTYPQTAKNNSLTSDTSQKENKRKSVIPFKFKDKSLQNPDYKRRGKCKIESEQLSDSYSPKKRKIVGFSSPSSKVKKRSSSFATEEGASGLSSHAKFKKSKSSRKFSPQDSNKTKNFSSKNSPTKYFDYRQRRINYCAIKNCKKKDLLSKTGLNLSDVLRDRLLSSASNQPQQIPSTSSNTEIYVLSDSDSDVIELYTDPRRYSDLECMIVYESQEQIILDSD